MRELAEWQKALDIEIQHLKTFGSTKYWLSNGRRVEGNKAVTYYFDVQAPLKIPTGASIRLEWGTVKVIGQILSVEGLSVMVSVEKSLGDLIDECVLYHDPWELLDHLNQRLDEIKKSKKKLGRVKALLSPPRETKHPEDKSKSPVHELLLRSKYNPVTYVWGPPGTGKTYTLARVAANHYFKKRRVLILSQSNQAVDVLLSELARFTKKKGLFHEGDVIRYGSESKELLSEHPELTSTHLLNQKDPLVTEEREQLRLERRSLTADLGRSFSQRDSQALLEIEKKLARVLDKLRQKENHLIKEAMVVGTTLAKAATDPTIFEKTFDVVIVDEASMVYIPQAGFAATLAKKVIICGDFKQLPPIASSRDPLVQKWLKTDIFHESGVTEGLQTKRHPQLFILDHQRRMHPDISAFTNRVIYYSLVKDHPNVLVNREPLTQLGPFKGSASILLDTEGMGGFTLQEKATHSRFNLWQLLLSFQIILESILSGSTSIGYVTPYRAQAHFMELLIADLLKNQKEMDILAATVHRFQGSERDIMIFDTVDSFPESRPGFLLTGKESERLINVALTRTKGKFIHVSDTSFIHQKVGRDKVLSQLVAHQEEKDQWIKRHAIGSWINHQHPCLKWGHAKRLNEMLTDLDYAKEVLVILEAGSTQINQELEMPLRKIQSKLTLVSEMPWEGLTPDSCIQAKLPFSLVIFDQKILWLGLPLGDQSRVKPPHLALRLESREVIHHFLRQLPL
jgi:hypothetical protein